MKFTTKLFLTWISIFLIFYLTVIAIIAIFWSFDIKFWQLALVFIIAGIIPPAFLTMLFYKKLDYMESNSSEAPSFRGQIKETMSFKARSENYYNELFQKIDRGFIISYSDKSSGIIKFRTDSRIMSWGVCGYVKLLDNKTIDAIVYPMNPDSYREDMILKQSLNLLRAILNK